MNSKIIKVLLVEDNAGDARLIQEALMESEATLFSFTHVQRFSDALTRLSEESYDAVLLDLGLPDSHGLDTLVQARERAPDVPIVVLTGFGDEGLAVRAVQEGAQDYLVKGQVDNGVLIRSVRYAIERKRVEEAAREREVEAAKLANLQESRHRIVTAQEQVRKEIAQELHGPVQTTLFMVQQRLRRVAITSNIQPGKMKRELVQIANSLDDLRESYIRPISHRLHPSIIMMGLGAGLRSLRDQLERAIPIELEIERKVAEMEEAGASSIPETVRLGLYRVAEEAMANILKHSKATNAAIRLGVGTEDGTLLLSIEDNGQGFDAEVVPRGLGFTTIDDYLGAVGGSYTLDTAPGQGTKIVATIPLNYVYGNGQEEQVA